MDRRQKEIKRVSFTLSSEEKAILDELPSKFTGVTPQINKSEAIRVGVDKVNKMNESEVIQALRKLGRFPLGKPPKSIADKTSFEEIIINDNQWKMLAKILAAGQTSKKEGRPKISDRQALNGILFIFRNKKQRRNVPLEYGSFATCRRRLIEWRKNKKWKEICSILISQTISPTESEELERILLRTFLIDTK